LNLYFTSPQVVRWVIIIKQLVKTINTPSVYSLNIMTKVNLIMCFGTSSSYNQSKNVVEASENQQYLVTLLAYYLSLEVFVCSFCFTIYTYFMFLMTYAYNDVSKTGILSPSFPKYSWNIMKKYWEAGEMLMWRTKMWLEYPKPLLCSHIILNSFLIYFYTFPWIFHYNQPYLETLSLELQKYTILLFDQFLQREKSFFQFEIFQRNINVN